MKQKLIALLKTSFASKGFNAKELESLADLIIAQNLITEETTDEDLTAAVTAAKPTADFVQSVASRQVNDAKKPKVETAAAEAETEEKKVDPNETATDKALRLIMEKLEKTEQQLASFGKEKLANTRRDQFAKTLDGTSEVYKTKALKDFDRLTFKDDEDFTSWLTESTEDAKAFAQDEANQDVFGKPAGGVGGNIASTKVKLASEEELDAVMDNL